MPKVSVVLLSGGLDSAANLALCRKNDRPALALTANYGQRAFPRELAFARKLAHYYEVAHQVVDLPWLGQLRGNALTDPSRVMPEVAVQDLDRLSVTNISAEKVWVWNRNGVLINVAAAYAESLGAGQVVVGFNAEEAVTFPDNSVEFLERATEALRFSTRSEVQVVSYTQRMSKREIVQTVSGLKPEFPFDSVWSCYEAGEKPCGRCESCRRLARALEARVL